MKKMLILISVLLSGCGTTHRIGATNFLSEYNKGKYNEAALVAVKNKTAFENTETIKGDLTLSSLNAGLAKLYAGEPKTSIFLLDFVDDLTNEKEQDGGLKKAAKGLSEILLNASIFNYDLMITDRLFINPYKAIAFLQMNDPDNARVELQRAYQNQKKSAEFFRSEIEKANKEIKTEKSNLEKKEIEIENKKKEEKNKQKEHTDQKQTDTIQPLDTKKSIKDATKSAEDVYADLDKWKVYKDFVNPYSSYLSGLYNIIYANNRSDKEMAVTDLKRVYGMVSDKNLIKSDLQWAEELAKGQSLKNKPATVWLIFENGGAPIFEEVRIDIPLFTITEKINTLSMTLPKPVVRDSHIKSIDIFDGDKKIGNTTIIADIDAMFMSEFKKKQPVIISKAVISTILKGVMQYYAKKELGDWGGLAMTIMNVATTTADLRSWYALPKNIQMAKFTKPKKGILSIKSQNFVMKDIELPKNKFSIVYIRIPDKKAIPSVSIIPLEKSI